MLKKIIASLVLGFAGYVAFKAYSVNSEESYSREITNSSNNGILSKVTFGIGEDFNNIMGTPNELMGLSLRGMAFIKGYEAFRAKPYYATNVERKKGILTVGYGYTYNIKEFDKVATFENGITKAQAEKLFIDRVYLDEKAIRNGVKVKLNQGQFDALVSLRYNVGSLAGTNLINKINKFDFDGAANEFMGWIYQDGEILNGLYKRRASEVNIFKFGKYDTTFG